MKKQQAFIFLGKSGSGKGTQAELLVKKMQDEGRDVYHLEMGHAFRDFLRESNYTSRQALEIAKKGGLQPDFLANYFFTEDLIKYMNDERSFIFDGTPRTKRQAKILDGSLRFYGIEQPIVVHLDISDDLVMDRMRERGRDDDQLEAIKTRLEWFKQDTTRALDFFTGDDYYRVITLDGGQDIDEIHQELLAKLGKD